MGWESHSGFPVGLACCADSVFKWDLSVGSLVRQGCQAVFQDQMGPQLGFVITSGGVGDRLFPWQGDASD